MAEILGNQYTRTQMAEELNKATTAWGTMMQESLDGQFGKGKAGFCLIICSGQSGGSMHMKTNLKTEGLVALFRELADKVAQGMRGYIIH